MLHYTYVSGGATCMQALPADTTTYDDGGSPMAPSSDAGTTCTLTQTGCMYMETCDGSSDAGTVHLSLNITVNSDGSYSGTESFAVNETVGGQSVMVACTWGVTATKQ